MTLDQTARLARMGDGVRTQDNRITSHPIFVVEQRPRKRPRASWRFVQPFFTEVGAQEYIKINGHNLGETRIYVHSGWRNSEWQVIRDYLAELPVVSP